MILICYWCKWNVEKFRFKTHFTNIFETDSSYKDSCVDIFGWCPNFDVHHASVERTIRWMRMTQAFLSVLPNLLMNFLPKSRRKKFVSAERINAAFPLSFFWFDIGNSVVEISHNSWIDRILITLLLLAIWIFTFVLEQFLTLSQHHVGSRRTYPCCHWRSSKYDLATTEEREPFTMKDTLCSTRRNFHMRRSEAATSGSGDGTQTRSLLIIFLVFIQLTANS